MLQNSGFLSGVKTIGVQFRRDSRVPKQHKEAAGVLIQHTDNGGMLSLFLVIATASAATSVCEKDADCNHGFCPTISNTTASNCVCFAGWSPPDCQNVDLGIYTAQGNFFVALAIALWVVSIPLGTLMCLHNKSAPVQGRHPLLVVISVVLFLIFVTAVLLERVYPYVYSCSGFVVMSVMIFGLSLWTMFVRTWLVYFMFMATAERAERRIAERDGGVRVKNGWFVSHRWMTSVIFQYVLFGVGFVALLITTIVFAVLTQSTTNAKGFETCSARTGVFVTMAIIVLCIGAAWAFFSFQLRRVPNDGFFIKKELMLLAVTCLVAVILFLPLSTSEGSRAFANDHFSFDALVAGLTGFAVVFICFGYPLSKLHIPRPVDEDQETLTLEEVLAIRPEGRDAFRVFLVSEFSVENMLVLDDIEKYKAMALVYGRANPDKVKKVGSPKQKLGKSKSTTASTTLQVVSDAVTSLARPNSAAPEEDPERKSGQDDDPLVAKFAKEGVDEKKLQAVAKDIYTRYIDQGAPDQVNLSSQTASRLKAELAEKHSPEGLYSGTLFDEVQHEVVALCRRDTFPRFCRSPIGKELKEKLGKAQDDEFRMGLVKHFCKLFAVFCLICSSALGGVCCGGAT